MEEFIKGKHNLYLLPNASTEILDHLKSLNYKEHVFIKSSGTTELEKIYALSKDALIHSANQVNKRLEIDSHDSWGIALPQHHIGGFSIYIRAQISNSNVFHYNQRWNPITFKAFLNTFKITTISLVPTQLFDLVINKIESPKHIKRVIIGGDYLHHELAIKAIDLGWPIYHTYGMTEFCSQIATSKYSTEGIKLLDGYQAKITDNRLMIKSKSLFTSVTTIEHNILKTTDASRFCNGDFFITQDLAHIDNNGLLIRGRVDSLVKINGHFVDLFEIEQFLSQQFLKLNHYKAFKLATIADNRSGNKILIMLENKVGNDFNTIMPNLLNSFPFIKNQFILQYLDAIPKNELGKQTHKHDQLRGCLISNSLPCFKNRI